MAQAPGNNNAPAEEIMPNVIITHRGRGRGIDPGAANQPPAAQPQVRPASVLLSQVVPHVTPEEQRQLDATLAAARLRFPLMTPGGRRHFLAHISGYVTPINHYPRPELRPLRQPRN
jgi:hypothetical protein